MAEMRRPTVVAQLAVLVLVAAAVAPSKSVEDAEVTAMSNVLAAERKTSYTIQAEGVIYCRCNLTGYLKPVDAAPLPGNVYTQMNRTLAN